MKGANLSTAISNLEADMKKTRVGAIKNNVQNAAYIAYEMSQAINSDPAELAKLQSNLANMGVDVGSVDWNELAGLKLSTNKDGKTVVVDSTGTEISVANGNDSIITQLFEGDGSTITGLYDGVTTRIDPTTGKSVPNKGFKGAIKGQVSADKQSVSYKHQTKMEQERKDKDSKK